MSCGCSPLGPGGTPAVLPAVDTLADLAALDPVPDGSGVYVIDQAELYRLDALSHLTPHPTLIITADNGGRWFRRSKQFVIGNYTLWVAYNSGGPIIGGFPAGQVLASNSAPPELILDMTNLDGLPNLIGDGVVDAYGNLWIQSYHNAATAMIGKFRLNDCLKSGAPFPEIKIPGTRSLIACFDRVNNLWTQGDTNTFKRLAPYQYRASTVAPGPTPIVSLTLASGVLFDDTHAVFDGFGNLWFSKFNAKTVNMVTVAQQQVSNAALVPQVVWSGLNVPGPEGIAFGPNGLLWVASYAANTITAFTPNQLTGNPAVSITLTSTGVFNGPDGLCFDRFGNLWVGNFNDNKIAMFTPAQLATSGNKAPTVFLQGQPAVSTTGLNKMFFPQDPTTTGLIGSGNL